MTSTPKLLTEYISTDSIVPVENAPVKILPATLPCPNPSCGSQHGFTLYRDLASASGETVWGFCTRCGTTGDVIDLYMRKTGAITAIDAVRELRNNGWVSVDDKSTDKMCLEYALHHQVRRSMSKFWENAHRNLGVLTAHPVLTTMGLENNHSTKFLGSATREQVKDVFKVDLRTAHRTLVVPFQDMPGRISMFRIYYLHGSQLKQHDIQATYSDEPGIFMLESVKPHCDLVLAVDDPLFAFQMQNHFMMAAMIPRPIIAYTTDSIRWESVLAGKVIFWTQAFNVELFKAARFVPGSMVSLAAETLDRVKHMKRLSNKAWENEVKSSALPWLTSFGMWLCTVNRDEASAAVRELDLTSTQRQDLIDGMSNSDARRTIRELLEANSRSREVQFKSNEIIERDGSWYAVMPGRRREYLVSDTLVKFTGTVCLSGAGNYYTGVIVRRNVEKRFYAHTDMIDSANKKWLEDFCLENDMGCPEIGAGWGPRLFAVARTFSGELDNETREGKVGWSKDLTSFNLPKRVIRNGRIEAEIGMPVTTYPCQLVTGRGMSGPALRALLENTKPNAQFWALFSCSMMNAAAPFFGIRKRKIGAVGQNNFVASFAKAMDFCTVQVTKKNHSLHPLQHDVPLHMSFDQAKFHEIAKWLNDPEEKNILAGLDYLQAVQIADEDWVFVHTGDFSKISDVSAAYDLIPYAMKFVQTCKHKVKSFTPDIFLHTFKAALKKRFLPGASVDFAVMEEAGKLISHQSPLGTTYGQSFLFGVFLLMQEGKVRQTRAEDTTAVVISNESVAIPKSVVNKVVLDGCTQRVGQSLLEESAGFGMDYTAWRISRKYWEHTFALFQKEQIF